jgi:hypothetical protein
MGGIRHLTGGTPQIIEHVRGQLLSSRLLRNLRGGEVGYGLDPCWRCHDMILLGFCHQRCCQQLTASDWFSGIGFFFVGGGNQARFDIVVTCYFC